MYIFIWKITYINEKKNQQYPVNTTYMHGQAAPCMGWCMGGAWLMWCWGGPQQPAWFWLQIGTIFNLTMEQIKSYVVKFFKLIE